MFDKTYIIYLGVGIVIVAVAFFAYQELQKHKTEIQKLRYESEKLQKIIHAYNMKQWHQDPSEEPNDSGTDESDDSDSDEAPNDLHVRQSVRPPRPPTSTPAAPNMQNIIAETLQNLVSASGANSNSNGSNGSNGSANVVVARSTVLDAPTAVITPIVSTATVNATAPPPLAPTTLVPTVMHFVTAVSVQEMNDEIDDEDLPEVETFATDAISRNASNTSNTSNPAQPITQTMQTSQTVEPERHEELLTEQLDNDDNDDVGSSAAKTDQTHCSVLIKGGPNKGQICGGKVKVAGLCVRHYKSTTPQN